MRGKDGRLYFSERDRGNVWKDHMEEIMNEENDGDHVTEADVVEGPIENVTREEVMMTMKAMKLEKSNRTLRCKHGDDNSKWRDRDQCDDGAVSTSAGRKRNAR